MNITPQLTLTPDDDLTPAAIVSHILEEREIEDPAAFLQPPHPETITLGQLDDSLQPACEALIAKLEQIRLNNQSIVVYTDYDADGVTGGAIMWEALHRMGFTVMPYVPHRVHEGYGFSIKGIDHVKEEFDPALIISVDHGITAEEKIKHANDIGIPVVVTDHHLKPESGPPGSALAVFHIPALSGSGVSYMVARFIYHHFKKDLDTHTQALLDASFAGDYLCLASIGSVADLVPLVGPTRSIVYHGLEAFKHLERIGLKKLMEQAGIGAKPVTPYEIGFVIAPRINAIGRLEHALDALRLLCTTDPARAQALTDKLQDTNAKRQDLVKTSIEEAIKWVEDTYTQETLPPILVVRSDSWHEGIIGLIASKLVEKYWRPTIVMTRTDGFYKASARSIPALHLTDFLREHKSYLVDVGGHAQAAGFTIQDEQVDGFIAAISNAAGSRLTPEDLERVLTPDIALPVEAATLTLSQALDELRPFGIGNPTPQFVSTITPAKPRTLGKDGSHLAFAVKETGTDCIAFGMGEQLEELKAHADQKQIVYTIGENEWQGNVKLQLMIRHIG